MGLYSFVTLVAFKMNQRKVLVSMEEASWYDKKGELTFSDILALVRRDIWFQKNFSKPENKLDLRKYTDKAIIALIYLPSMAA